MLMGLTGGIACGKTTVAKMFERRGAQIIDADGLARRVVEPGHIGLSQLVDAFGKWILTADGRLDRERLASHIFAHPEARSILNGITHPLIAEESQNAIIDALEQAPPLVVYDAALLFESGRADGFRPVVVVHVDPTTQVKRLMQRDGLSSKQAQQRIDAQMPVSEKMGYADYLVDNSAGLADTRVQVERIWEYMVHDRV
ncbi:MAG: dephospho-CoA kinase [Myxococcales bacterium]|nr:dephospho-CoA kinase [Myxococcales bacterium]|tara:strand:- start:2396 stop:2995 length:600 start_codon:yes stop_codon:yes gene_type:complete